LSTPDDIKSESITTSSRHVWPSSNLDYYPSNNIHPAPCPVNVDVDPETYLSQQRILDLEGSGKSYGEISQSLINLLDNSLFETGQREMETRLVSCFNLFCVPID
jgi:hypothetical protein